MRTRFLNNDYFTLPPSQRHETLPFLHLPVPRLSTPLPSSVHDHLRFHPPLRLSLLIDPLPIDAALSTFLSEVLPHRIHVESRRDLSVPDLDTIREQEAEVNFEDHASEADIEFLKEGKTIAQSDRNGTVCDLVQFETPELGAFLENECVTEKERMQMLSQTPEVENSLEMVMPESLWQYPYESLESVSKVEDVISEYLKEEKEYSLEVNISMQHLPQTDQNIFLVLEVEEESLGIPSSLSMLEIVDSYFESIRPQKFDEVSEGKELLGSIEHNMMKFFSEDCMSKKSLVLSDLSPENDFINMLETEHVDENIALGGTWQVDSALLSNFFTFQEFVFLDKDLIQTYEAFYDTKASVGLERSDWMFQKEFNFKSFDELIVNYEMALIDDTFKSLPVPVISDNEKLITLHDIIDGLFSNMKLRSLSASDDIYLNWDLLDEDKCNYKMSNWYQNTWAKIDMNNLDFTGNAFDNRNMVFDLVFCGDTIDECDIKQSEELKKLLSDCIPLPDNLPVDFASSNILQYGSSKQGCRDQLPERNAEKASLLFNSMSEISNLDYFLNPQKATAKGNCNFAVDSTHSNVNIPKDTSTKLKDGLQSKGWHTVLHRMKLSNNIVAVTGYFEKCYLAILQSDTELTKMDNSAVDYFKLLSISKRKLFEYHATGNNMAFIVLSAIKQAAWYLCFYGLNPACLYIDKLCQNMDCLKSRLGFLQSVIKDEKRKVEGNYTMAHPSLTIVKEILQSSIKRDSLKVLVVADQVFWWSLKNLLLSLGLSFSELNGSYKSQPNASNLPEETYTKMKDLLISDCLLVSRRDVSPSFPFNKFGIVLEYGGPCGSSRISELSPNSVGLPHLHFLTVDLDDHAALKALCEGVEMPPNTKILPETETPLIYYHKESMENQKLERLLNFCPVEQSYDIKSPKVALAPEADSFVPVIAAVKTEHGNQSLEPFSGSVIIVNTQNKDKEMIVSRRSSYQVVLAMEKAGVQVAERDLDLPVDIIISAAICLAWYDSRNLGKKATPATEASSSLPLCIENIATDVLTLLSFYFRGCILVFEGEFDFLSIVMESSDGLYAAAASLGIDLQIFFSYSPELTNEVILSCIKSAAKLIRGLYPKMPESVTLAESFLTQFPGINPLTAHSILSSGAMLNEFLECSHEQRMRILENYDVPEECLSLFSVFCKYGELEDSKSIMTDCSSSVSSGPDSDRCHQYQVDNKRKRKTPMSSHQKDEQYFDELLQFKTINQAVEGIPGSSTSSKPFDSKAAGRSRDFGKASLGMSEFFNQKQPITETTMRNPSRVSMSSLNCDAPRISEQVEQQPCLSFKHNELVQNEILDIDLMSKSMNWHSLSNSGKLHEDVRGEVVDLTDSPLLDESFPMSDSMYFPSLMTETEKDQLRKNKIARRLSFGNSSQPATNSSTTWTSSKDTAGEVDDYPEPDFGVHAFPLDFKPQEKIGLSQAAMARLQGLHENIGLSQTAMTNLQGLDFQDRMSHLSETPLSRARRSASPLRHSPWTIEFLNKVKEKSKMRQKSLSCQKSHPCFGYQGNVSKVSKRRSPSIIEFFKYQPGRTPGSFPEHKRQKQSGQSSNSVKKGRYSACLPSCTPDDKRSTKTLTFGKNVSGSQTKLVWSDKQKFQYQAQ